MNLLGTIISREFGALVNIFHSKTAQVNLSFSYNFLSHLLSNLTLCDLFPPQLVTLSLHSCAHHLLKVKVFEGTISSVEREECSQSVRRVIQRVNRTLFL